MRVGDVRVRMEEEGHVVRVRMEGVRSGYNSLQLDAGGMNTLLNQAGNISKSPSFFRCPTAYHLVFVYAFLPPSPFLSGAVLFRPPHAETGLRTSEQACKCVNIYI